jgi:TPR repeat protein
MKKIVIIFLLLAGLVAGLVYSGMAHTGAFETGLKYYNNGNYKKAVKWYRKAAEQGVAEAQCNLGNMYINGEGVKQDLSKAKMLFGQSCDNGNQNGCHNYRILNEQGVQ